MWDRNADYAESHVSPALDDLLDVILALLLGEQEAAVLQRTEPGEYRLLFRCAGDAVKGHAFPRESLRLEAPIRQHAPYSSREVRAMIEDCRAALNQSPLLRVARGKAKKTGDRAAMFVLACEPIVDGASPASIAAELERVWQRDLRFEGEAHRVEQRGEGVCLDFVTWWERPDGLYVTGTFAVAVGSEC